MDRTTLGRMTRQELIAQATALGAQRPEVLTRAELIDEILRRSETDVERRRHARGWFGVARDLLASLVEQGLNLPDAARLIRGEVRFETRPQPPVATVTLAEIYASQGHPERALRLLEEVLAKEPDHEAALALRQRLLEPGPQRPGPVPGKPEEAAEPEMLEEALGEPKAPDEEFAEPAAPAETPCELEPAQLLATVLTGSEASASVPSGPLPPSLPQVEPGEPPVESNEPRAELPTAAEVMVAMHPNLELTTSGPLAQPGEQIQYQASALEPQPRPEHPGSAAPEQEPQRDILFLIPEEEGSVYLYWEISSATWERRWVAEPPARLVAKIRFFTPERDGVRQTQRDLELQNQTGAARAYAPSTSSFACAALGWNEAGSGFRPLAVATELDARDGQVLWTSHPGALPSLVGPKQRAIKSYACE